MATYYWVGGAGTWNGANTANWSTSSGGAGGAGPPTSADNIITDALSNATAYAITISSGAVCADATFTGPATGNVTLQGTGPWNIAGSLTLPATGLTWSYAATFNFTATTTGKTITTNGLFINGPVNFTGVGGGWTLGSAYSTNQSFTVTAGSFSTGNFNVTCAAFSISGSTTRSVNLGSSAISVTGWTATTITNLTFNAGTSTITITPSGTFSGGGLSYYNLSVSSTAGQNTLAVSGANTFNNLTLPPSTQPEGSTVTLAADQVVNGVLTANSSATVGIRVNLISSVPGTTRTLTVASTGTIANYNFQDITIAGAAAPVSGTSLGNRQGNTGINFPSAKTVYWSLLGGGTWSNSIAWATSSGGTPSAANFPLPQDTVVFDNASLNTSGSVDFNAAYAATLDLSARSNAMTITRSGNMGTFQGSLIGSSAVTWSASSNPMYFEGRGSFSITSVGATLGGLFNVRAPGGTYTLVDALSVQTLTLTAGTFNSATFNVTTQSVTATGTLTRAFSATSGTWSVTTSGASAFSTAATGLSVSMGATVISMTSATAKTFAGSGLTWPTLNQGGAGALTITGSNSFANITNTTQPATVLFTAGTTNTFAAFSLSGTSGNLITIGSVTAAKHTLSKPSGTVTVAYCSISRSTATGGATWDAYSMPGNVDGGNNSGWLFTAPSPSNFFLMF